MAKFSKFLFFPSNCYPLHQWSPGRLGIVIQTPLLSFLNLRAQGFVESFRQNSGNPNGTDALRITDLPLPLHPRPNPKMMSPSAKKNRAASRGRACVLRFGWSTDRGRFRTHSFRPLPGGAIILSTGLPTRMRPIINAQQLSETVWEKPFRDWDDPSKKK